MIKAKDNFENGYFWEYYMDLEWQFIDFMNYVPYLEGNENVYSFRLMNLILAIGAHVDSAFKEIFRFPEFSTKYEAIFKKVKRGKATITNYRELDKEYSLSKRQVMFKCLPERESIIPFQLFADDKSPKWWSSYNKIKHEFSKNFKKATYKTARDALAGAFLLNVIHEPAIIRLYEYGIAKENYKPRINEYGLEETIGKEGLKHYLKEGMTPSIYVETVLFVFKFESVDNNSIEKYW